jgi:hypothetical protein
VPGELSYSRVSGLKENINQISLFLAFDNHRIYYDNKWYTNFNIIEYNNNINNDHDKTKDLSVRILRDN